MVRRYLEWLKESEKIVAEPQPSTDQDPDVSLETPSPATVEPPTSNEPSSTSPIPVPDQITGESNIEQYRKLDKARRESIKAFKIKNEEFLEIPDEIRKNPIEETDKTKVSELKAQLVDLHTKMKAAIDDWDKFVSFELGIEGTGMEEEP